MNLSIIRRNPLSIPIIMADKMDIFKKYKVNINLDIVEDFTFDGQNPYFTGESDGMVGDTTFFFYMLKKGKPSVITSDLTRTISLIIRKEAKDKEILKAGVNRAGLFRLLLESDLKEFKNKIEIVWINNTYERMEAFKKGDIDLLVAIEPFVSDFVNDLKGEIIWSLRESDKNLVMWAFHKEYYKNNIEELKQFYKAMEEAQELFNNLTGEEKVKLAIEIAGYSEKDALKVQDFSFEKYKPYNKKDFDLCQDWMYRAGEIDNLYNSEECLVDILV